MRHPENPAAPGPVRLREAIDRIASELLSRPELPPPRPAADIFETPGGEAYVILVPAPGLSPDEITLSTTGQLLSLEIRPRSAAEPERTYVVQELNQGPGARIFSFPTPVDPERISARLEHGMLRIDVPKADDASRRIIPVRGTDSR